MSQFEIIRQSLQKNMEAGAGVTGTLEIATQKSDAALKNLDGVLPKPESTLKNLDGALPKIKDANLASLDGVFPKDSDVPSITTNDTLQLRNAEGVKSANMQADINKYNNDVKNYSAGGDVHTLRIEDLYKRTPEELQVARNNFNLTKEGLIKNWENQNYQAWPRYKDDVYSDSGKLIRRQGDRYDAHHVQPLGLNGENFAENITPMHARDHYDKQGIHQQGSPYDNIVTTMKG